MESRKTLPGGRGYSDGSFDLVGNVGNWWSTIEVKNFEHRGAHYQYMGYDSSIISWYYHDKDNLFSVRCVKD